MLGQSVSTFGGSTHCRKRAKKSLFYIPLIIIEQNKSYNSIEITSERRTSFNVPNGDMILTILWAKWPETISV